MGTQYAGSQTFPSDYTIPDDGDPEDAASVNVALEALGDRTAFLRSRLDALPSLAALTSILAPSDGLVRLVRGFGIFVFDASATPSISPFALASGDGTPGAWVSATAHQTTKNVLVHPANCGHIFVTQTNYTPAFNSGVWWPLLGDSTADLSRGGTGSVAVQRLTTASPTSFGYRFPIDQFMIDGATLASVTMRFQGSPPSRGANLPALMPQFGIQRFDADDNVTALLSTGAGLVADPSATVPAFTGPHNVIFTPNQNNVIDKSAYGYSLIFWNEGGTNALNGDVISSFLLSFTNIPDARRS